ncbi:MAG: hypothetical protein ACYTFI_05105 [Planctomycetota bacterium]|jgi:hypothetical protein
MAQEGDDRTVGDTRLRGRRAIAYPAESLPRGCPSCNEELVSEHRPLAMGTHDAAKHTDLFIVGTEVRFCPQCQVVVLNASQLDKMAAIGAPDALKYVVIGFIDIGAVPEDKRHLPLDEIENIPYVRFDSLDWA